MCTATNHRLATQIAAHFGLFTGVLASTEERNLLGSSKAKALVDQFGDGGFDYCGDAMADVPVWRQARRATVVGDKRIAAATRKVNAAIVLFEQKRRLIPLVLYLLNDMLALDADRRHTRKRNRPFASGRLPLSFGVVLTVLLLAGAVGLAVSLPWKFGAVLAAYFAATLAYSFALSKMHDDPIVFPSRIA